MRVRAKETEQAALPLCHHAEDQLPSKLGVGGILTGIHIILQGAGHARAERRYPHSSSTLGPESVNNSFFCARKL